MALNSLLYNIKQGFLQIFRNKGMSLASIFSILAMLLILGIFFLIAVNLNLFTEVVKQDYDQVEVFLLDEATEEQVETITAEMEDYAGVTAVTYRSKEEALDIMKERWGESGYLLDSLGDNPLPASLLISVDTIESAQAVSEHAAEFEGVEDVQFYQETVDKLTRITNFLQIGAVVVMIFLIVVSVVVVSNTIKLTVFARAREIRIMKYVGATNWFIRGPFISEGIIIGLLGAVIPLVCVFFLYRQSIGYIAERFQILSGIFQFLPLGQIFPYMAATAMLLGLGIGFFASFFTIRKHLKV